MCKKEISLDSAKFRRIWPGVRNSVNAKGRFHSYQGRQAEIRRRGGGH